MSPDTRCLEKREIPTVSKFDGVTRFRETNSTVKSISLSEIKKIFGFQPKLMFYHFSEKLNYFRVLHIRCLVKTHNQFLITD